MGRTEADIQAVSLKPFEQVMRVCSCPHTHVTQGLQALAHEIV